MWSMKPSIGSGSSFPQNSHLMTFGGRAFTAVLAPMPGAYMNHAPVPGLFF
jgi:hypothetical protein